MKFLLNDTAPTEPTVHVTTQLDSDGDIEIRYDGVKVGWIFSSSGKFVTRYIEEGGAEAHLSAKGVQFEGHCILIS